MSSKEKEGRQLWLGLILKKILRSFGGLRDREKPSELEKLNNKDKRMWGRG